MSKNTSFVGYYRVSTVKQKIDGLGINSQMETVRDFVARQGGVLIQEFRECESGKKTDRERPALRDALELCKRAKATLVVGKLDRLSRNAEFLLSLQNAGVDFVCCDCPNVDNFTCGILVLCAQREREMIALRTREALQIAKKNGVRLGCPNPQKQVSLMNLGAVRAKIQFNRTILPIVQEIKDAGVQTLQEIANCLNRRGIQTRTGKMWFPSTVRNALIGG